MEDLYNQAYFINSIEVLNDLIKDLGLWSAYNKDQYHDEISSIYEQIKELKKKAEGHY